MPELTWYGKYDEDGKRSAPLRIALPFQTVETVNESAQERQLSMERFLAGREPEWRNRLIWGDKKYVLPALLPEFAGQVDLIYIDPPFATGADFSFRVEVNGEDFTKEPSILEQKAYRDTWGVSAAERQAGANSLDKYLSWLYEALVLLRELLAPTGSIYVHMDAHIGHYAKTVMDEIFPDGFQREIIWRMGWISGYKTQAKNWIRNHDTILYYVKNASSFTFNRIWLPYPPDYERWGGRQKGKGLAIEDIWGVHVGEGINSLAVVSYAHENLGFPTQKPEALLERIITASSNEGDLVLDCFVGSGTTAAVAEKLRRRWIAADMSRFAVHTTRKRLLTIPNVRPFIVQNLGKYER